MFMFMFISMFLVITCNVNLIIWISVYTYYVHYYFLLLLSTILPDKKMTYNRRLHKDTKPGSNMVRFHKDSRCRDRWGNEILQLDHRVKLLLPFYNATSFFVLIWTVTDTISGICILFFFCTFANLLHLFWNCSEIPCRVASIIVITFFLLVCFRNLGSEKEMQVHC